MENSLHNSHEGAESKVEGAENEAFTKQLGRQNKVLSTDLGVKPPKGFRDLLPKETVERDRLLNVIIDTYRSYGFERIETPAVEDLRRLKHSEGGENLGLMFRILKRGDKLDVASSINDIDNLADLGLRYDLTVPVARYYANNRESLPRVFKSIQIGSVWRAERPQQGRYRQFTQCDIDIIGGQAPYDEVELVTVTLEVLGKMGIRDAMVRVNDRRLLSAFIAQAGISTDLTGRALVELDKMDKIGVDGVRVQLLESGFEPNAVDSFIGLVQRIENCLPNQRLAKAKEDLGTLVPEHVFSDLSTVIDATQVALKNGNSIVFDPFLVRGMGYYTGIVFEIVVSQFSGSIAGGGRYDKLIGNLSGVDATACGFSIGFERLVGVLGDKNEVADQDRKVAVFFNAETDPVEEVLAIVQKLRADGAIASMYVVPKNMKATLARLKQVGFNEFGFFSPDESMKTKPLQ
jgi:histidyl-tRNA synthetase